MITLGMTDQALGGVVITDVEALLGRRFVGLRQNADVTANWTTVSAFSNQYDLGYVRPYKAIQIQTASGWGDVIAGTLDATLQTLGSNIAALPAKFNAQNTFLLCFAHETSIDSTQGPVPGIAGTNQQAIDAFRRVRNVLDAAGATRLTKTGSANGGSVEMVYNAWDRMLVGANGVGGPTALQGIDDLDPDKGSSPAPGGTSYYEWMSGDIYNVVDSPGVLRYGTDASTLLTPLRTAAVARSKDWIMPEFGCGDGATTQDHTNKAAWLDSARTFLESASQTSPGVCRGIWLTFKSSAENYMVDSSAEALAAYRRLGRSPLFAGLLGQSFDTLTHSRSGRVLPLAY